MPQPTPYAPETAFWGFEASNSWFPGHQLDAEFVNLDITLTEILANLELIQRDDGAVANATIGWDQLTTDIQVLIESLTDDNIQAVIDALVAKADVASPTFTGIPAAPTAAPGVNTTQLASTAFVQAAVAAAVGADLAAIEALTGTNTIYYRSAANTWTPVAIDTTLLFTGGTLSVSVAPSFKVHKNGTNQTGVADSTFTTITWPTEAWDIGGFFASDGWTPPAGKVLLICAALISGTIAVGNLCVVRIVKGAVGVAQGNWPSSNNLGTAVIVLMDQCDGSETYKAEAYIDLTSGTGDIQGGIVNTYFTGVWSPS